MKCILYYPFTCGTDVSGSEFLSTCTRGTPLPEIILGSSADFLTNSFHIALNVWMNETLNANLGYFVSHQFCFSTVYSFDVPGSALMWMQNDFVYIRYICGVFFCFCFFKYLIATMDKKTKQKQTKTNKENNNKKGRRNGKITVINKQWESLQFLLCVCATHANQ